MQYRVHNAGDGRFEIQRIEPVTIGVMYNEALADLVLAILETDDDAIFAAKAMIDEGKAEAFINPPPAEVAAALPEIGNSGLHKIGGETIEKIAPAAVDQVEPRDDQARYHGQSKPVERMPKDFAAQAKVATENPVEPVPSDAPVTPMHEAFMRIDAGEKLGKVADDLGLKMPMVRAAYARRARAMKEEGEAAETASPADTGPEECRMCGREFRASDHSDGLCARCQRGV